MEPQISLNDAIERVLEHVAKRQSDIYQLAEPDFFRAMNCELGLCQRIDAGMDAEQAEKLRREEQRGWAARHQAMQHLQAVVSGLNALKAGKL